MLCLATAACSGDFGDKWGAHWFDGVEEVVFVLVKFTIGGPPPQISRCSVAVLVLRSLRGSGFGHFKI